MATKADLEQACRIINRITGKAFEPYTKDESGQFQPNPGCYHLSGAYGGWGLVQMCDTGTGVRSIIGGHMPKKELLGKMSAFIEGLRAAEVQA
tara:strand:- start:126 stop:404 length:279 start_codon:yes stop_codon:yes gene_type:complete